MDYNRSGVPLVESCPNRMKFEEVIISGKAAPDLSVSKFQIVSSRGFHAR
ncbi:MAG: hypothetical protein ACLTAF_01665 [Blautia coccoides]